MGLEQGNMSILNAANGVTALRFPEFEEIPWIRHGFSTRIGGVSKGIFDSMNLSFGRGDSDENVRENFTRFCAALDIDPKTLVLSSQDHHTNVLRVSSEDCGKGIWREKEYESVDGLITDEPGVALVTFYADCVPLYFVDPVHRAIGLSHAGWRGTVAEMGRKTIECMTHEFGSNPADMLAAIGPSIGPCCYEVDDVVIDAVKALQLPHQETCFVEKGNGKYLLNLWEVNVQILIRAGIPEKSITVASLCTCCEHETLISHRATGGQRGGMAAILSIYKEPEAPPVIKKRRKYGRKKPWEPVDNLHDF